jgi:hypothetical protein
MDSKSTFETIMEPAREIKVVRKCDVVVVGGGPGGVASAISAARNGADTVLIERYGHLGGMATGGLVNIIPNLSEINGKQRIAGLVQEIIDRMDARGAADFPRKEDWGTTDTRLVNHYLNANLRGFYIRKDANSQERVLYTALVDPEVLKDELNEMVSKAGVKLYLHSWGVQPVMEGRTIKGVIFESKSGRQAVLGKVVIDSTGDGDLLPPAGAECVSDISPNTRIANLAFAFWIARVDLQEMDRFKEAQPPKYAEIMQELTRLGGFTNYFRGLLKDQEHVIWFHPHIPSPNQADVEELTRVDVSSRKRAMMTYEFLKKNMPGFERCHIMQTAPQLGTTGGKRVIGEYVLRAPDLETDEIFEDTIAIFPNNSNRKEIYAKHPSVNIPYRVLVPRGIEGLLVACRAFSSDETINNMFNLIPNCICFGQAAGTAAAVALNQGVTPRKVEVKKLQGLLIKQGVILPEKFRS